MSNLQTYYHFKLDFQTVDQHTGGKCLIHAIKMSAYRIMANNTVYVKISGTIQR